jgi:hypothetical protein
MLVAVALIHLLPVLGLLGVAQMERAYGRVGGRRGGRLRAGRPWC